ncbi:MAG TPA: hypothetical protein VNG90_03020 [Candidatus Acidoferrum sp.]|nr:hypothetical protein [Candidatus Acidoferrum sp.]
MSFLSTFFGDHQNRQASNIATILDMVTYAASRVSNPQEIDLQLDTVREITSRILPDEPMSQTDEMTLVGVYTNLEHYLATKDPVQTFAPSELRGKMTPGLLKLVEQYSPVGVKHP